MEWMFCFYNVIIWLDLFVLNFSYNFFCLLFVERLSFLNGKYYNIWVRLLFLFLRAFVRVNLFLKCIVNRVFWFFYVIVVEENKFMIILKFNVK